MSEPINAATRCRSAFPDDNRSKRCGHRNGRGHRDIGSSTLDKSAAGCTPPQVDQSNCCKQIGMQQITAFTTGSGVRHIASSCREIRCARSTGQTPERTPVRGRRLRTSASPSLSKSECSLSVKLRADSARRHVTHLRQDNCRKLLGMQPGMGYCEKGGYLLDSGDPNR